MFLKKIRENIFLKWNVENIYQFCWKFSSACRHAFYLFILREEGFILAKLGSSLLWSGGQGGRGLKKLMSWIYSRETDGKDSKQAETMRSSSWVLAPTCHCKGIAKHLLECLTFPPTFYWLCHIRVILTPPLQPLGILWNWENSMWCSQSTYHHLPQSSISRWLLGSPVGSLCPKLQQERREHDGFFENQETQPMLGFWNSMVGVE